METVKNEIKPTCWLMYWQIHTGGIGFITISNSAAKTLFAHHISKNCTATEKDFFNSLQWKNPSLPPTKGLWAQHLIRWMAVMPGTTRTVKLIITISIIMTQVVMEIFCADWLPLRWLFCDNHLSSLQNGRKLFCQGDGQRN